MRQYVELLLTCENDAQAAKIAQALLDEHMIACSKRLPIEAKYWWQGEVTDGSETLLLMESAEDLFDQIEDVVAQLHSYDTFVLQAMPFVCISKAATAWLEDNLKKQDNGR